MCLTGALARGSGFDYVPLELSRNFRNIERIAV